jgi:hypothetical protein
VAEDWSGAPVGSRGIPPGWRKYETPGGHPNYDFTLVDDRGRRALDLKSAGDHSTIAKEVFIDLDATPIVEWQWKVISQPVAADLRRAATSDATGHLFLIWPRFPELLRSRLIGYVWDPTLPVGSIVRSQKTSLATFVVVRSGGQGMGEWAEQQRDIVADYRTIFAESVSDLRGVALSIDTNDTHSKAEAMFGRIALTRVELQGSRIEGVSCHDECFDRDLRPQNRRARGTHRRYTQRRRLGAWRACSSRAPYEAPPRRIAAEKERLKIDPQTIWLSKPG